VLASAVLASGQPPSPRSSAEGNIFSGIVTAVAPDRISVSRKVLAKADQSRDFAIDKDTKVEGHLRVNARVSVRFKTGDDGVSHALHIIVRADARITGGPEIPRPPSSKK
jgi:hypothetical protein